uniref:Uncharacterized protein n=1 Tax=Anguilla anguilla TaxID=7936 RepID=A0A0E9U7R6_ANGAN
MFRLNAFISAFILPLISIQPDATNGLHTTCWYKYSNSQNQNKPI